MTKGELGALICLAHCLGLTMAAVGRILRAHGMDMDGCTLGEAIGCLVDRVKFAPPGVSSLVKDVVDLFDGL